jgi:hypothetical protein
MFELPHGVLLSQISIKLLAPQLHVPEEHVA